MTKAKKSALVNKLINTTKCASAWHERGLNDKATRCIRNLNIKPQQKGWQKCFLMAQKNFYEGLDKVYTTQRTGQGTQTQIDDVITEGIRSINTSIQTLDRIIQQRAGGAKEGIAALLRNVQQLNNQLRPNVKNTLSQMKGVLGVAGQTIKKANKIDIIELLLLLFTRYHACIELAIFRREFEDRLFQYICRTIQNMPVRGRVNQLFSSLRNEQELFKEGEVVYTLGIFLANYHASCKAHAQWLKIFSYAQRAELFLLRKDFLRVFNDLGKLESELEEEKEVPHRVTVSFLKGVLYYGMHSYSKALRYFGRVLEIVEKDERIQRQFKGSFRLIQGYLLHSRTCWQLGMFRQSIISALKGLKFTVQSQPQYQQSAINSTIKKIDSAINEIERDLRINPEKINKKTILKCFCDIQPCCIAEAIQKFPIIASKIFLVLGHNFMTLRLDFFNKKLSCAQNCNRHRGNAYPYLRDKEFVIHWLFSAIDLDPGYGTAYFDIMLYYQAHPEVQLRKFIGKSMDSFFYNSPLERKFALQIMHNLVVGRSRENRNLLESCFLRDIVTDIDKFIQIPREIHDYISKSRTLEKNSNMFVCLRRWSSLSPLVPRPKIFNVMGGGDFLVWNGKGIAIDPGFDFLINLYNEGFSLADIDAIIVTHDHIDHIDDLFPIINLNFERIKYSSRIGELSKKQYYTACSSKPNIPLGPKIKYENSKLVLTGLITEQEKQTLKELVNEENFAKAIDDLFKQSTKELEKQQIELFLNPSTFQDVGRWIKTLEGTSTYRCVSDIKPLSVNSEHDLREKFGIKIETMESQHLRGGIGEHSVCLKLKLYDSADKDAKNPPRFVVGITSDTAHFKELDDFFQDCQILVAHSGHLRMAEFKEVIGFNERDSIFRTEDFMNNTQRAKELVWIYGIRDVQGKLVDVILNDKWSPKQHLYFDGIKKLWTMFNDNSKNNNKTKIFIISEFAEEMGPYRYRMAFHFNNNVKRKASCKAFTGDIGLKILLGKHVKDSQLYVECSKCAQDNNLMFTDRFYLPQKIKEVCIKQDAQAMVYFCKEHDARPQRGNRNTRVEFTERVERFTICD